MSSGTAENIHILLPRDELKNLKKRARAEKKSVAELIRRAVRKFYHPATPDERRLAFERLSRRQDLAMTDWKTVKEELLRRHG